MIKQIPKIKEPIISDEEIVTAFNHTNFGRTDNRTILEQSVLKKLVGYPCGYTITVIMQDLELIGKKTPNVTKKGKRFVADAFKDQMKNSG